MRLKTLPLDCIMNPGNRITSFEPLSFRRMSDHKDRRSFLYTAAAGLVVGTHPWDGAPAKAATPLEPWLAGLNGQDKQFLDVAGPDDGKPLRHVDNFLTAYTAAYKLQESDISILFGAHEAGLVYVRSGALWHKFALGELFSVRDVGTGAPAVRNVFFAAANMPAFGLPPNASACNRAQEVGFGYAFLS